MCQDGEQELEGNEKRDKRATNLGKLSEGGWHDEDIGHGLEREKVEVGEVEVDILGVLVRDRVEWVEPEESDGKEMKSTPQPQASV